MPFISFFGTNLLTQCQVPVPVFSMFLTPFRGDFETESKRKKISEKIFSGTEEDRRAWGPSQESPRGPTSPHPAARGPRHAGLWAPWRSPDLDLAPINSQIFPKNQESIVITFLPPQAFVSTRSHLGHVLVPCRRGDSDTEGFFINTMTSPMMCE